MSADMRGLSAGHHNLILNYLSETQARDISINAEPRTASDADYFRGLFKTRVLLPDDMQTSVNHCGWACDCFSDALHPNTTATR